MSEWDIQSEEASIVLTGSFNPRIFHPEWFIRKEIVEEWDYTNENIVNIPDLTEFTLPNNRKLMVLLNQFQLRSSKASDYTTLKDIISSTFTIMRETPIFQMGMNFTYIIKIHNFDKWKQFGKKLAPQQYWEHAAGYIKDLEPEKQKEFGLWDITMNLPRSDDLKGFVRPRIVIKNSTEQTFLFSVNNHVEIENKSAKTMVDVIDSNWEKSLDLAKQLKDDIMSSQFEVIE